MLRHQAWHFAFTYRNSCYNINHNLKHIAGMVGVTIPLTLYVGIFSHLCLCTLL